MGVPGYGSPLVSTQSYNIDQLERLHRRRSGDARSSHGSLHHRLEITEVSAELSSIVPGRQADDNAHIKLRFNNGAKGMMWASMVATGHWHGLRIRVYGETGSLEWVQEQPNELVLRLADGHRHTLTRGYGWLSLASQRALRL